MNTEYNINKTFLWRGRLYRQNEKYIQNSRELSHADVNELQRLGLITKLRDVGKEETNTASYFPTSRDYKQIGFRFVK